MSREIEDRLRAALSAKTDRISEADLRPPQLPTEPAGARRPRQRFRRTLPWLAPALAAAAVAIVVVGVVDRSPDRRASSTNSAAGRASSTFPPPVTAPTRTAKPPVPSAIDSRPLKDAAAQPLTGLTVPEGSSSDLKPLPAAVLGSAEYWAAGNTRGFGESHPTELNTDGDPSGIVLGITWQNWGSATATGLGRTYLPKPAGGYYPGTVAIQLQATKLGRCGSVLGYTQLYYRTPSQPGGEITGPWQLWANATDLCKAR